MNRPRRTFSRDDKLAAVNKVIDQGLSFAEVAHSLGIRETMLRNWKKAFEADGTLQAQLEQPPSVDAELKRLHEEHRRLTMERDILRSAKAFFDKKRH